MEEVDVKDQMTMRRDELGENCENLKTKVISHSPTKAEQSRVGQADTVGPMDVDNASGGQKNDEDQEAVDKREMLQLWTGGTHCQGLSRRGQGQREICRKNIHQGHRIGQQWEEERRQVRR